MNRQVYYEARKVFRLLNIFVGIETPWEEAEHHVSVEGHVPIVIADERADAFDDHTLSVEIDAHEREALALPERASRKFVILIDDLEAFTRMWFYSDLNYAGHLNPNLCLTLRLRNPYVQSWDDSHVPKAVQRRLFEPFQLVKGLSRVDIVGEHYSSLGNKMREGMAMPYDPPWKCLEESSKLLQEANVALSKREPARAIELCVRSFEKIFVVCAGRRRSIWGDAWFDGQLTDGEFKGQHGQFVRLGLRVTLVANIVKANLMLKRFEEAEYWGMRTIALVREAVGVGFDDAVISFPASEQLGKIYYMTGVAYRAMGQSGKAWGLLNVAKKYLPDDEGIKRELAAVNPVAGS